MFKTPRHVENSIRENLLSAVGMMAICDAGSALWLMVTFIPVLFGTTINQEDTWRTHLCSFMGFWGNSVILASLNWFFIICVITFAVVRNATDQEVTKTINKQYLFAWGSAIAASTGALLTGLLGPSDNPLECWLKPGPGMLLLYIPCGFYFIAAWLLLFYTAYVLNHKMKVSYIISRMLFFVLMFVVTWTLPLIDRIWIVTSDEAPPEWLSNMHFVTLSLMGFCNFLVWRSSHPLRRIAAGSESLATEGGSAGSYGSDNDDDAYTDHRNHQAYHHTGSEPYDESSMSYLDTQNMGDYSSSHGLPQSISQSSVHSGAHAPGNQGGQSNSRYHSVGDTSDHTLVHSIDNASDILSPGLFAQLDDFDDDYHLQEDMY